MRWMFIIVIFILYISLTTRLNMIPFNRRKMDRNISKDTYFKLSLGVNALCITIFIIYYIFTK